MPEMSGYVKTFKAKDGDKDKNNKLMSFRINDEKLLEKYKGICAKIEDSRNKYYLQVYSGIVLTQL